MSLSITFFNLFDQLITDYTNNGAGAYLPYTSADSQHQRLVNTLNAIQIQLFTFEREVTESQIVRYLSVHALLVKESNPIFTAHVTQFLQHYQLNNESLRFILDNKPPLISELAGEASTELLCHLDKENYELNGYLDSDSDEINWWLTHIHENRELFKAGDIAAYLALNALLLQQTNPIFCQTIIDCFQQYNEKTNRFGSLLKGPPPALDAFADNDRCDELSELISSVSKTDIAKRAITTTAKIAAEYEACARRMHTLEAANRGLREQLEKTRSMAIQTTESPPLAGPPPVAPPPPVLKHYTIKIPGKKTIAPRAQASTKEMLQDELSEKLKARNDKLAASHTTSQKNIEKFEAELAKRREDIDRQTQQQQTGWMCLFNDKVLEKQRLLREQVEADAEDREEHACT